MTIRECLQHYYPDYDIEGLREVGRVMKDGRDILRLDAALRQKEDTEGEWVIRSFEIVLDEGVTYDL